MAAHMDPGGQFTSSSSADSSFPSPAAKTAPAGPIVDVLPEADVDCTHATSVREVNEEELPKAIVETLVVLVAKEEDKVVEVVVPGCQLTPLSSLSSSSG